MLYTVDLVGSASWCSGVDFSDCVAGLRLVGCFGRGVHFRVCGSGLLGGLYGVGRLRWLLRLAWVLILFVLFGGFDLMVAI